MGFDLTNTYQQDFHFNQSGWGEALRLAELYGWEPKGTDAPDDWDGVWDGSYVVNDGEWVTESDAVGIAIALEHALLYVPVERTYPREVWYVPEGMTPEMALHPNNYERFERDYGLKREQVVVVTADQYYPMSPAPTVVLVQRNTDFEPVPTHYFSGADGRAKLQAFIAFCRRGDFRIA